jgi:curved DNA-binding protein
MFDVEGHNLTITVPLAPWEAALGTTVTVPTLHGNIKLTIPPDSQSGRRMRIRGKGLATRTGRGDLYAIIRIVIPELGNQENSKLWSELAEKTGFNPRSSWENVS